MSRATESSFETTTTSTPRVWSLVRRGAAATMLLLALARYRSSVHPTVLGRWSTSFVAFVVAVALTMLVYVTRGARARSARESDARRTDPATTAGETAFLIWSAGYLLEALANPDQASALVDGNVIGALTPTAAFLEWLALPVAFVTALHLATRLPAGLKNVALVAGTLIVTGLIGEGVARVAAHVAPEIQGYPSHRSRIWNGRFVRVNSSGFRDTDHPSQTPTPGPIVAVVGDSYALGVGIDDAHNRFGEKVVEGLRATTTNDWTLVNASLADRHTLQEFALMDSALRVRPDVVILLYVFNDIDYLRPVTRRLRGTQSRTIVDRVDPVRLLYLNSYLFTEASARLNQLQFRRPANTVDPYADSASLVEHLEDLRRLLAKAQGIARMTLLVPFDIGVNAAPELGARYLRFVCAAERAGIPVVDAADAFKGEDYRALRVNELDAHPNERANALLAAHVASVVTEGLRVAESTTHPLPLRRSCRAP